MTSIFFFIQCIIKQLNYELRFCDIQNNQGRGKSYKPQHLAWADNRYLDLDYAGYQKNHIQQLF